MTLHYRVTPDTTGVSLGPVFMGLDGVPLARAARRPVSAPGVYARIGKRAFDVTFSAIALFLAAPVMLLLALALWIEGGRPVFTQTRLGRDGRVFRMYKLRTMVIGADRQLEDYLAADPALRQEWNHRQKLREDPRITPLGRLLRKTSMDELPQLLNVLKGDMSLVGPRPMLPEQLPLYAAPSAYLPLRPGLTGLWQVTARNDESFDLRAALDQHYAQRVALGRDLGIILATFGALWRATGY